MTVERYIRLFCKIYLNNLLQGFIVRKTWDKCKLFFKLMPCKYCRLSSINKCSSRVVIPLPISISVYLLCLLQRCTWKCFQGCHSLMQVKFFFHCRPLFTLDLVSSCSVNHISANNKIDLWYCGLNLLHWYFGLHLWDIYQINWGKQGQ